MANDSTSIHFSLPTQIVIQVLNLFIVYMYYNFVNFVFIAINLFFLYNIGSQITWKYSFTISQPT